MKLYLTAISLLLFNSFQLLSAEVNEPTGIAPEVQSIDYVISHVREDKRTLIRAKVIKQYSLVYFLVDDKTQQITLNIKDVPSSLSVGDEVYAGGIYRYNDAFDNRGEIKVFDLVRADNQKGVQAIIKEYSKYIKKTESAPIDSESVDIEMRLKRLQALKDKNLITNDEYNTTRLKILNEL